MKRKGVLFLFLGVLLVALFYAGWSKSRQNAGKGAVEKDPAVPVSVEIAKRGDVLKELIVSGQVTGEQSVVVAPKISGKVAVVSVDLGSEVGAGDVLFTLDDSDIRAQVAQAEAAVVMAGARLKTAEQNRENSLKQYERYKELYEHGVVSADTLDAYAFKLEQANSEEPEAALAQSRAALSFQQNQLANTVIASPIGGTVALRGVDAGSIVSPATQAVTVVDLARVKVQVSIGEQQIGKIKPGQEVKVVVPAAQTGPFTGVVSNISPAADPKTKSFLVEIKMDNPNRVLKQGMFAQVHIVTDRREGVLLAPVDALVAKSGTDVVFTVEGGLAKENKVKTGISDGKVFEILSGLQEGAQVVVMGQQGLVDGFKVVAGVEGEDRDAKDRPADTVTEMPPSDGVRGVNN